MKNKSTTEIDVLEVFVSEMEAKGQTKNATRLSIDSEMVAEINSQGRPAVTLDELQKITDKCLANE